MPANGNRFPAEWERHSATWLTWPHNRETWPQNLSAARREFETLVRTLAEVENVNLLATGELAFDLQDRFRDSNRVTIFDVPTNDSWIRDYGPTFVWSSSGSSPSDFSLAGIDWHYDGWGEKYPPFELDQRAARRILNASSVALINSSLILEGGSIDSNGRGTVLTTSMCQSRRNPKISTDSIGDQFKNLLGTERLIVLDSIEIQGDDTDGHIDQVARFVSRKRIVVSQRQWKFVEHSLTELEFELIAIPDPDEVRMYESVLPASYTNFYIANELVIVPSFGVSQDSIALSILSEQFSDRFVISLPSRELAVGLGSFHCLTQQQPGLTQQQPE